MVVVVHKNMLMIVHFLRTILSALQTPTNKLAKFLVSLFKSLTTSTNTVRDLVNFALKIVEQDSSNFINSLDIDSLFTNVPLEKNIGIYTSNCFKNKNMVLGLKKNEFKDLLYLATKESYFIFKHIL